MGHFHGFLYVSLSAAPSTYNYFATTYYAQVSETLPLVAIRVEMGRFQKKKNGGLRSHYAYDSLFKKS